MDSKLCFCGTSFEQDIFMTDETTATAQIRVLGEEKERNRI